MTESRPSETHPSMWRAGWRAALSGTPRDRCPHTDRVARDAWFEGYNDAESERAKDVGDVRVATGRQEELEKAYEQGRVAGIKEAFARMRSENRKHG